jgi:hypothetical protein
MLVSLVCLVVSVNSTIDEKRLISAIGYAESTHCSTAVGDQVKNPGKRKDVVWRNGKAYLAYGEWQNHLARWIEGGGTARNWKTASREVQLRVMTKNMNRYARSVPGRLSHDKAIIWIANFHNIGHGSLVETDYTRKVLKFYRERK